MTACLLPNLEHATQKLPGKSSLFLQRLAGECKSIRQQENIPCQRNIYNHSKKTKSQKMINDNNNDEVDDNTDSNKKNKKKKHKQKCCKSIFFMQKPPINVLWISPPDINTYDTNRRLLPHGAYIIRDVNKSQ